MPRRRKKEGESGRAVDITSFFSQPSKTGKEKPPAESGGIKAPLLLSEVEKAVYERVKAAPGGIGKSELYHWAKKKGIKPADLYKAIVNLVAQGKIRRVFDPEREEYVYVVA